MQDKELLQRAKRNRKALGPFEAKLWSHISRSQLGGHKFRRQHVIDQCIVDFFCPEKGLIVEVDGDTHDPIRDAHRGRRSDAIGYSTLRFTNAEIAHNIDGVLIQLLTMLENLPNRWWGDRVPHPSIPPPEGEGKP